MIHKWLTFSYIWSDWSNQTVFFPVMKNGRGHHYSSTCKAMQGFRPIAKKHLTQMASQSNFTRILSHFVLLRIKKIKRKWTYRKLDCSYNPEWHKSQSCKEGSLQWMNGSLCPSARNPMASGNVLCVWPHAITHVTIICRALHNEKLWSILRSQQWKWIY